MGAPTRAARPLGRTGLTVAPLGLGGAPLSGRFGPVPEQRFRAVLDTAFDRGLTFLDTAAKYAAGAAEALLGDSLAGRPRSAYTLCTKMMPVTGGLAAARTAVEGSLARLRCDVLDIVLLHDPDDLSDRELVANVAALSQLRDEGMIRAIGIGIGDVEILLRALDLVDLDCLLLSGRYTLLDGTAAERLLPICQRRGVGVIAGSVFNSGILATGARSGARYAYEDVVPDGVMQRTRRIAEVCVRHGVPLATAAIQFAARHPAISTVLVGTTTPEHLIADHEASLTEIPDALWDELRTVGVSW